MGFCLAYIIKASICLTFLFTFFKITMSRETFHALNRVVLLGIAVLSFILPYYTSTSIGGFSMGDSFQKIEEVTFTYQELIPEDFAEILPLKTEKTTTNPPPVHLFHKVVIFGFILYIIGVIFCIVRIIQSLFILQRKITLGRHEQLDNYVLVILPTEESPCSWGNYIILSENDYNLHQTEILIHEKAHLRLKHSIDILFSELLIALQWFNPTAYLIKQDLQSIHEYEADSEVLKQGIHPATYQLLLIKKAVGSSSYTLANSFNHSSLKKRITMMLKKKSNRWATLKTLGLLPLIAILIATLAQPEVASATQNVLHVSSEDKNNESLPQNHSSKPEQSATQEILLLKEIVRAMASSPIFKEGEPSLTAYFDYSINKEGKVILGDSEVMKRNVSTESDASYYKDKLILFEKLITKKIPALPLNSKATPNKRKRVGLLFNPHGNFVTVISGNYQASFTLADPLKVNVGPTPPPPPPPTHK